jgi:hypothetical protein
LGKSAEESDVEKIIENSSKTSYADQVTQVQENVHSQIKTFCTFMDEILLPNEKTVNDPLGLSQQESVLPRRSGLSLAVGKSSSSSDNSGEFFTLSFGGLLQFFYFMKLFLLSINTVS